MRKLGVLIAVLISLICLSGPVLASDCLFEIKNDESLSQALHSFHEVLAQLVHGPAAEGDLTAARARAEELSRRRDEIMKASLPERMKERCEGISTEALQLARAVDDFVRESERDTEGESMKAALERMHAAYRELRDAVASSGDLLRAFHHVLHPLWHEAYPDQDTATIKGQIPKLKARAKLILQTAKNENRTNISAAEALVETVETLEEAAAAGDDLAIVEALKSVHNAYEKLAMF